MRHSPTTNFTTWAIQVSADYFFKVWNDPRGTGPRTMNKGMRGAYRVLVEGDYTAEAAKRLDVSRQCVDIGVQRWVDAAVELGYPFDVVTRLSGRDPYAVAAGFGYSAEALDHSLESEDGPVSVRPSDHIKETLCALTCLEHLYQRGAEASSVGVREMLLVSPGANRRLDASAQWLGEPPERLAEEQRTLLATIAREAHLGYLHFRNVCLRDIEIKRILQQTAPSAAPKRYAAGISSKVITGYAAYFSRRFGARARALLGLDAFDLDLLCDDLDYDRERRGITEAPRPAGDEIYARALMRRFAQQGFSPSGEERAIPRDELDATIDALRERHDLVLIRRGRYIYDPEAVYQAVRDVRRRDKRLPVSAKAAECVLRDGLTYKAAEERFKIQRRAIALFAERVEKLLALRGEPLRARVSVYDLDFADQRAAA